MTPPPTHTYPHKITMHSSYAMEVHTRPLFQYGSGRHVCSKYNERADLCQCVCECACTCVCARMHACTYMCECVHVCMYVSVHTHMCACMCKYICVCAYTYACKRAQQWGGVGGGEGVTPQVPSAVHFESGSL